MSSQTFGLNVLEKYGRGRFDPEQKEELQAALRKELRFSAGTSEISNDTVEKEISRFLDFGYASENNLDRLRRRVLRNPADGGRPDDGVSMKSSMAYSQPGRVGKQGTDTPVPQLFSIKEGMKSQTESMADYARSARKVPAPEADICVPATPNSARSALQSGGSMAGCKWSTVAKLQALKEVTDAETRAAAKKNKQLQLKGFLDEQVEAKSASSLSKADELRKLRTTVDDDYQRLQEEDNQKKKELQKKITVLKNEREEQVLCARIARQLDRKEILEAGQKLNQQCNVALEAEQKVALQKKVTERQAMSKLIVEWEVEKQAHMAEQKVQNVKEREAVLKLEEELKAEQLQKKVEIQKVVQRREKEFQQLALAEASARQEKKVKREARIKEENRELECVNQANEAALEKERLKKLKQKADRVKNVDFLLEQMAESRERKTADKEKQKDLLTLARSTEDKFAEEERQKTFNKRKKNIQHRLELEEQIEARSQRVIREDLMSTSEAFINKNVVAEAVKFGLN